MSDLNSLVMKVNTLETHDRLLEFTKRTKQSDDIGECCQDMMRNSAFGTEPFYIFVHSRTDDDGFTQRLIWQPRLTKPKAQTNSMLFKAYPTLDQIKVLWIIPKRELWDQYKIHQMTANETVLESIEAFENRREELEKREDDDLSDDAIDRIYASISNKAKERGTVYQRPILS